MNDLVSDMLARIRNGYSSSLLSILVPCSGLCKSVLAVLEKEGYISGFELVQTDGKSMIRVHLKYAKRGDSCIVELHRVSRPGRRVYTKIKDLGYYKSGLGSYILSTPKGVLSDKAARKLKVGGEVICKIF